MESSIAHPIATRVTTNKIYNGVESPIAHPHVTDKKMELQSQTSPMDIINDKGVCPGSGAPPCLCGLQGIITCATKIDGSFNLLEVGLPHGVLQERVSDHLHTIVESPCLADADGFGSAGVDFLRGSDSLLELDISEEPYRPYTEHTNVKYICFS